MKLIYYLSNQEICRLSQTNKYFHQYFKSDKVWEMLWYDGFGRMWKDPFISLLRHERQIHWNPYEKKLDPKQGWFKFYLQFEYCWLDWLLAGMRNCSYFEFFINDVIVMKVIALTIVR
jgi:hypothetical protein